MNCLLSFKTKGKRTYEQVRKHKIFCDVMMFNGKNKILNYFYGHKPMKKTFVIDIDFEIILEKNWLL